jgi:hypothetical protein
MLCESPHPAVRFEALQARLVLDETGDAQLLRALHHVGLVPMHPDFAFPRKLAMEIQRAGKDFHARRRGEDIDLNDRPHEDAPGARIFQRQRFQHCSSSPSAALALNYYAAVNARTS